MKPIISMKTQTEPTAKPWDVLLYLFLLTAFFILLEVSFFIQTNKAYLFDFQFVSSQLKIPASILPGIAFFLGAQLLVHAMYCIFIWTISVLLTRLFNCPQQLLKLGLGLWLLGMVTVATANQYLFPNSKFADLSAMFLFTPWILKVAFSFLIGINIIIGILAVLGLIKTYQYKSVPILVFFVLSFYYWFSPHPIPVQTISNQPNVFIIGIDSLRPDFLPYFGGEAKTVAINDFLNHATVFTEAVTPLARTFPSWVGILTGEYPKQTGLRSNLAREDKADLSQTLPNILRQYGYKTILATDETRFSNIDKKFGYEEVITPPIGLNDFLLGTFNDFPLTNILINTQIGKWLFPYNYFNRASFVTYQPETFLNEIAMKLNKNVNTSPIFMSVHFCLPHYPYLYGKVTADLDWINRYKKTVQGADKQVQGFLKLLRERQLLNNAIVILLSDHGEALELPGDRITNPALYLSEQKPRQIPKFYPASLDTEAVDQSAGHGTDVLGLSQYHTLLAIRLYGKQSNQPKPAGGFVSLLDVKPSILDLLDKPFYGHTLKPIILSNKNVITDDRDIFLESDYSPSAIRTLYPETRKVLLEGVAIFRIDPITTRLIVKDSMAEMINRSKQLADIYQGWMLALYPQNQHEQIPILVNLKTGEWTNNLHSLFAKKSPANHMLTALKNFYGDEVNSQF